MLDALLDAGADINARSRWWAGGFGLLDWASPELAAYAIERGAVVDAHAAARLGMIDRLRELISLDPQSGPCAAAATARRRCTLPATSRSRRILLDHGADIDARDIDHESTPAQYMSTNARRWLVTLVSRGCKTDLLHGRCAGRPRSGPKHLDADPDCIRMRVSEEFFPKINPRSGGTIYGWTLGFYLSAHQVARKFGHDDVLALLFDRSPTAVQLIEACWLGDEAIVHSLRAKHPNLADSLIEPDRRQVAHAARKNQTTPSASCSKAACRSTLEGQHNATPLHWAAFHGNADMAKIVLGFARRSRPRDADFHATPLGWAIYGSLKTVGIARLATMPARSRRYRKPGPSRRVPWGQSSSSGGFSAGTAQRRCGTKR